MKVLMINGSPHEKGCTYTALHEIEKKLQEHGIESEIYHVGKAPISGCIGCGKCAKTGKCVWQDGVNDLVARLDEFNAVIIGSPVHYATASGQATSFCDRLFYVSKSKMAGKLGAAVTSARRAGTSATLDQLNKYFTINNMPIVPSQYWNQVHGATPEDVLKDGEGMQTMRILGENMAWLLKCIEAGEKAGVPKPQMEPRVRTNFIR